MKPKELGYAGEALAAQYLQSKGYQILENNFTIRGGEIDLVAKMGRIWIFVEVKIRTGTDFGDGGESVDGFKKMRIHRAIRRYIDTKIHEQDPDYRADLVEITLHPETKKILRIEHFEDIEL